MFARLFREEPEVLALLVIVALALFFRRHEWPATPRFPADFHLELTPLEPLTPKVQFLRWER
jgi:hypothetical protein